MFRRGCFPKLESNGKKCCYSEINYKEIRGKFSQCLSLSQAQKENTKYLDL